MQFVYNVVVALVKYVTMIFPISWLNIILAGVALFVAVLFFACLGSTQIAKTNKMLKQANAVTKKFKEDSHREEFLSAFSSVVSKPKSRLNTFWQGCVSNSSSNKALDSSAIKKFPSYKHGLFAWFGVIALINIIFNFAYYGNDFFMATAFPLLILVVGIALDALYCQIRKSGETKYVLNYQAFMNDLYFIMQAFSEEELTESSALAVKNDIDGKDNVQTYEQYVATEGSTLTEEDEKYLADKAEQEFTNKKVEEALVKAQTEVLFDNEEIDAEIDAVNAELNRLDALLQDTYTETAELAINKQIDANTNLLYEYNHLKSFKNNQQSPEIKASLARIETLKQDVAIANNAYNNIKNENVVVDIDEGDLTSEEKSQQMDDYLTDLLNEKKQDVTKKRKEVEDAKKAKEPQVKVTKKTRAKPKQTEEIIVDEKDKQTNISAVLNDLLATSKRNLGKKQ